MSGIDDTFTKLKELSPPANKKEPTMHCEHEVNRENSIGSEISK